MTDLIYDFMIVGTGPAGLTAAIYAQRLGLRTIVFGDTPGGNLYMIENLMNYPGFPGGVSGATLGVSAFSQAQAEGADFPMSRLRRLTRERDFFRAQGENGSTCLSRAAVLACGLVPRTSGIPTTDKKGLYFCSLCDGPLFRGKHATLAVLGGGNTAAQQALTLSKVASRVILVHRGPSLRAESIMQSRLSRQPNIEIFLDTEVLGFTGQEEIDGLIVSTSGRPETRLTAHGAFVAIGWDPNLSMLDIEVEKTPEGYVKTDCRMMSSCTGLFAAGDIRDTDMRQVITACADGARSAHYALAYLEGLDR